MFFELTLLIDRTTSFIKIHQDFITLIPFFQYIFHFHFYFEKKEDFSRMRSSIPNPKVNIYFFNVHFAQTSTNKRFCREHVKLSTHRG